MAWVEWSQSFIHIQLSERGWPGGRPVLQKLYTLLLLAFRWEQRGLKGVSLAQQPWVSGSFLPVGQEASRVRGEAAVGSGGGQREGKRLSHAWVSRKEPFHGGAPGR